MRILEVTDFYYPWIAGPSRFIRDLSTVLADRGHDVLVACPSSIGSPSVETGRPNLQRMRTWKVPFGYNLRTGLPALALTRLIRTWRPQVVHIHHPFPISAVGLMAARADSIPVLATNHTIPTCTLYGIRNTPLYRPAKAALALHIRTMLGAADLVTTPTETAAQMLRTIGFSREIVAISNGVDSRRFYPDRQCAPSEPVILCTGRLDPDKEVTTIVEAMPRVLQRRRARLRIGGEGTDRRRLEAQVRRLGLSRAVEFTGFVPDEDLPKVYRNATVYAISSPVELQSISTLEAMASGLPVVAADAGALPELVGPGVNGFLASPGDSEGFANALLTLLVDGDLRKRMGRQSRMIAEQHSKETSAAKYEQILERLAVERTRRGRARPMGGPATT